ncbi:hypothetical protein ZTR_04573 [Talaromyces verruculosus]|nr:hypothetical protein ZTR_04573 [Talaromyces verruculosus]
MAPLMRAAEEIRTASPSCEVRHIPVDVTVQESVYKLFEQMPRILDILINNAGVASSQTPLAESSIDDWWSDFSVSVRAVILNTSSSVSTTTNVGLSGYASAKTAVNRLTEFIQLEYSSQNVRCVAFHPGGILHTGMGQSAPAYFKPYLYDTVDLAAGTAVYLSTPRAGFLGGRFVFANYDMEALENLREEIIEKDLLKTKVDFGSELGPSTTHRTSSSILSSVDIMATAETLRDTGRKFIDALSSLEIDDMLKLRTPDCLQYIWPASMGRSPMTNDEFNTTYSKVLKHFSNYSITVHSVTVDTAQKRVVMHGSGSATTLAGPFSSEYIFILHMTENGENIRKVEEFVDSALSKAEGQRIRDALEALAASK